MAPGESTVVALIFKTRTYKTKISKYATIYSNDPGQSTVKIHLSANVYASPDSILPFTFSEEKVNLSKDEKKGKIVFENKGDSRLYIKPAGNGIEGLSINVKNDDPKPGQKSELRFEWKNEFEKENSEISVTFLTYGSESDSTRFSIPVMLQGTDPAPPPKVTRPKRTTTKRSADAKSKIVRKPARRATTAADDPRIVKPKKIGKPETLAPSKEKESLKKKIEENKSDDSPEATDIKSEDNQ